MEDTCIVCLEHGNGVQPRYFMPCRCVCAVCDTCVKKIEQCVYCRNAPPVPWMRLSQHTANYIDMLMRRMEVMNDQLEAYRREIRARLGVKLLALFTAFVFGLLVYQLVMVNVPDVRDRFCYRPVDPMPFDPRCVEGNVETGRMCFI